MEILPAEILRYILHHLEFGEIYEAARVCKLWCSVLEDIGGEYSEITRGNFLQLEKFLDNLQPMHPHGCFYTSIFRKSKKWFMALIRIAYNKGVLGVQDLEDFFVLYGMSFDDRCRIHGLPDDQLVNYYIKSASCHWFDAFLDDRSPDITAIQTIYKNTVLPREMLSSRIITYAIRTQNAALYDAFRAEEHGVILPSCLHWRAHSNAYTTPVECIASYEKIIKFVSGRSITYEINWHNLCDDVAVWFMESLDRDRIIGYINKVYDGHYNPSPAVLAMLEFMCKRHNTDLWMLATHRFQSRIKRIVEYMVVLHSDVIKNNIHDVMSTIIEEGAAWMDTAFLIKYIMPREFDAIIANISPSRWNAERLAFAMKLGYRAKICDFCGLRDDENEVWRVIDAARGELFLSYDVFIKHWKTCKVVYKRSKFYESVMRSSSRKRKHK